MKEYIYCFVEDLEKVILYVQNFNFYHSLFHSIQNSRRKYRINNNLDIYNRYIDI